MEPQNIPKMVTFESLTENQRKAIALMVTTNYTQNKIAEEVGVRTDTISHWKKSDKFRIGKLEYSKYFIEDLTTPAVKRLKKLLNAKSEMVQLQAVQLVFSMAGIGSVDRNPALEDAEIRKANAEADIKEAQARRETDGNNGSGHVSVEIVMPGDDENQD